MSSTEKSAQRIRIVVIIMLLILSVGVVYTSYADSKIGADNFEECVEVGYMPRGDDTMCVTPDGSVFRAE